MRYPSKRVNFKKEVEKVAMKAKYYAGFDETGEAYFNEFCKHLAKFVANNYRRRVK
jgi:hypothetical protein